MAVAGVAVASGLALTLAVPFVALHELIVKRHKHNMQKHLPQIKKRVNFACERPAKAAPPALPLTAAEEKAIEAALTVPLPLPPYKPALRAARQTSPPPAYDDDCTFEEKKVARIERPVVRFAQMA
ncbi:hypothetical protein PFISCL1PPCAC_22781 [Pristionchus fissidentatus]|uniref:Uncharacterized protein n=1 Tax=Pristionchus fissidentatus TaxID=1538716 RepID=A0AAV5WL70_9BILA|nr:hypothetical protein PFISCL1PPCAC_22781 [Pristionchus fissidentatus]